MLWSNVTPLHRGCPRDTDSEHDASVHSRYRQRNRRVLKKLGSSHLYLYNVRPVVVIPVQIHVTCHGFDPRVLAIPAALV